MNRFGSWADKSDGIFIV